MPGCVGHLTMRRNWACRFPSLKQCTGNSLQALEKKYGFLMFLEVSCRFNIYIYMCLISIYGKKNIAPVAGSPHRRSSAESPRVHCSGPRCGPRSARCARCAQSGCWDNSTVPSAKVRRGRAWWWPWPHGPGLPCVDQSSQ